MKHSFLIPLVSAVLFSCAATKQPTQYYPFWWEKPVEGEISSFGRSIQSDEKTARFAAQNDAFQKLPTRIAVHLNDYVAENCIAPGDEQIQNELNKIFRYFLNFFNDSSEPEIFVAESELIETGSGRKNRIEYFTRIHVSKEFLHAKFAEFLNTSDLYIPPQLRAVLRECFEE